MSELVLQLASKYCPVMLKNTKTISGGLQGIWEEEVAVICALSFSNYI